MASDRRVLRAVTDEVMHVIEKLSGQEYVDVYAQQAKEELAADAQQLAADGPSPGTEAERPGPPQQTPPEPQPETPPEPQPETPGNQVLRPACGPRHGLG
jgi:1-acyl-sn-glycerol-3-phosphate acyltransferase